MTRFKDHFSSESGRYAAYRPDYPAALFAWLTERCTERRLAWDCATGSGQAAVGLAPHFDKVVATDASAEQIRHAQPQTRVHYHVASAEASGLAADSVDLVAVAQAAHWFDLPRFYDEVTRVARPGAVIALWGYGRVVLPGPLDAALAEFYEATVGPYWPPERLHIDAGYRSLTFPFPSLDAPVFSIAVEWTLPRLIAYLSTWSAVKRYRAAHAQAPGPLIALEAALAPDWGKPETPRQLDWPLFLRAGRVG